MRGSNEEVYIISIAGLYRTGKSFLLNNLIDSQAFKVGPNTNAYTRGMWFSIAPILWATKRIYVLDTEWLGAVDQGTNHDSLIFVLAILASSMFIYNSFGVIDEFAINNLEFIANLTNYIHWNAPDIGEDERS